MIPHLREDVWLVRLSTQAVARYPERRFDSPRMDAPPAGTSTRSRTRKDALPWRDSDRVTATH
jgi:hypothetical protein